MEKFKKLLPQGLLLSFIIKMLIVIPQYADMGIVFALGAIVSLQLYLAKRAELEEVKAIVNKQNEVLQVFAVEHAKMKTVLEGVKLKNDFKNDGMKRVV